MRQLATEIDQFLNEIILKAENLFEYKLSDILQKSLNKKSKLFYYLLKIFNVPIVICPILAKESVIHLVIRSCCRIAQKRIYNLIKRQPT